MHTTKNKQTIEVVTVSEERRRRWSTAEKAALVRETYEPGMNVSLVARKHGISGSQLFNVIDDFNREVLGIEVDFSLPSERVIRSLDRIIEWRESRTPSAVITIRNTSAP